MPKPEAISEADYERACAQHILSIPFRRAGLGFPSFPMSVERVQKLLEFLGIDKTIAELEAEIATRYNKEALEQLGGLGDWYASDVLWVIGSDAK